MSRFRLLLAAVLSLSMTGAGCAGDNGNTKSSKPLPPPKKMNEVSADAKLREAEEAEKAGKYPHALECYEQLRSYPEAARPKDLDARIKRVEERMKAPPH